jgi:hypothetical protein
VHRVDHHRFGNTRRLLGTQAREVSKAVPGRKIENPTKPLRGFTLVYVPYEIGDVHLGSRDVTYEGGLVIRHHSRENVQAALGWAFRSITAHGAVRVAGESAGAAPPAVTLRKDACVFHPGRLVPPHVHGTSVL